MITSESPHSVLLLMNYRKERPQQHGWKDRKQIWFCSRLLLVSVFVHFGFCFL